ncbi:DUF4783 domain-containing protein [Lacihabitans sp. LS3-19]|uniref:DUF4783 domain-containing protein n=1 Tax=Lacihabitans sp. LS3-19 TaxID=2487335 RepID=UPI0020CDCF7C|nr:DUF4783 domain-containing protein [Lacihabitans sp. LS3-19]
MKNFLGLIFITLLSSYTIKTDGREALGLNEVSKVISESFRFGNSEMLSSCLNNEIELIIDGDRIEYQNLPANTAKNILNSFFKKNPPLSFSYVYQGANSTALKYCIGNYRSKNNDYLVYLLIKKDKNDRFLINTLQLKKD